MAITPQQRLNLLYMAKDHWIYAETSACAYQRALKQAKQWSDWLKIATIVSALLTTASSFANNAWLTLATGLLTTALATAEKLFLPTENHQKYWNCRTELAGVQRNLNSFAVKLDAVNDVHEGANPLEQMSQKIVTITQDNPVALMEQDRQSARSVYADTSLRRMVAQAEEATGVTTTIEEESLVDLPEDAPEVVAAYRPQAGGQ